MVMYRTMIGEVIGDIDQQAQLEIADAVMRWLVREHRGSSWPAAAVVHDAIAAVKPAICERYAAARVVHHEDSWRDPYPGQEVLTPEEHGKFLDTCDAIDADVAGGGSRYGRLGPTLKRMGDAMRGRPHQITYDAPQIRAERERWEREAAKRRGCQPLSGRGE